MSGTTHSRLRRRLIQASAAHLCTLGLATAVRAQGTAWPTKPIRFVCGFAPGGITDVMARTMAQALGVSLGQQVIVENRLGVGGNLSVAEVIRAPGDGYTFLVAPNSVETANPFLFKQSLDPARELTPVAGIGRNQMYLVVRPGSPFKTAKELVAYGRANPGKLSYASSGAGTPPHLAGELFKRVTGMFATHIPYRGSAPALQDVLADQVDYVFDPGLAFQHVRTGRVRMLVVAGVNRSPFFPEVPTMAEVGLKGAELDAWYGIWSPKGTPSDINARMIREIAQALTLPGTRSRYEAAGAEAVGLGNPEFRAQLVNETRTLSGLIKEAKISIE